VKIQIKSIRGKVLFSTDAQNLRDAVIAAVKAGVNLSYADLSRTKLSTANLSDANLSQADLSYANLSHTDLYHADLSGADLSNVRLGGANLFGVNLSNANLSNAELACAKLSYAILSDANLSSANLSWADLSYAILSGINLTDANLSYVDLSRANLSRADLSRADLSDADLSNTILYSAKNIPAVAIARTSIVPETGAFDGWKKCANGILVHLRIPAHAARSNATGRKCRASEAKVLEIIGAKKAYSIHDNNFVYRAGKTVKADKWNPNRWAECGDGIHFFLTRAEAENYPF
jgi:uncharacterized protein YjbI with pentapeptide repeats